MKYKLKAVHAFDVYEAYTKTGDDDAAQVYIKSEADKVIEDLKSMNKHLGRLNIIMASETIKYLEERHANEVKRLSMEIAELKAENERLKQFKDKEADK